MVTQATEVQEGQRFEFGKNWQRFLRVLNNDRVAEAEKSLREILETECLTGKSFLDIGSGSGLFSLAAMRLGAKRVHSFDYDRQSVACTQELKRRYFAESDEWTAEQGDVLDSGYLAGLGQFDVVYSWGVLHHTGNMWEALENITRLVAKEGKLFIAIYNTQVYWTKLASKMKRAYVSSPRIAKWLILGGYVALTILKGFLKDVLFLRNPLRRYLEKKRSRGMSFFYDCVDWLGGYPFETARPEEVFDFCRDRGFSLKRLQTSGGGHGCNEFVFVKCVE